ncbi:MAG: hypothetical protein H6906_02910 [Hyphomicrobiales bacterium]|nr:hypothetical protein [Hyphomicrobiales bacterium]
MPDPMLRSPLALAAVPAPDGREPGVTLHELRPAGLALVAAWPATLDRVEAILRGPDRVLTLGPGRFLVVGADADPVPALAEVLEVETAVVTDLGHARSVFRVAGPRAQDLLQKDLAFDLDPAAFAPGATAQAAIHHVGVIVHRRGEAEFELYCFRGFALSLWEWLADAALEYGCRVEASAF